MATAFFNSNELVLDCLQGFTRDINKIERRSTYDHAISIYARAREKLLDVNDWKYDVRLAGFKYILTDTHGERKIGLAKEGDYIQFKANEDGNTFYWVQIERILEVGHNDWKSFAIRLKSVEPPVKPVVVSSNQTYGNSNTLIIERHGNKVISYIHQNLVHINNQQAKSNFISKIRSIFFTHYGDGNIAEHNWETLIDIIME